MSIEEYDAYVDGYYTQIYDTVEDGSPLVASQDFASKPRDWNEEFQSLLDKLRATSEEAEELEVYQALSSLAADFAFVTKTYGKIIILERYLPSERKTIQPINIGGMAGGEKYISNGVLFKFAVDKHNLYGGDDGMAMKAANHELLGLLAYYGAQIEGLHVPLMSLIDYRGFRVVAMSILPLSFASIVYGSNNGGRTVHNKNAAVAEMMRLAAKRINIKPHNVGRGGVAVELCGPVDIEAHVGLDSRCYVLDFARVFPPEASNGKKGKTGSFMCEMLRPELVKRNETPLSSDANSPFGKHDRGAHDTEVRHATARLHTVVIPQFAKSLDAHAPPRLNAQMDIAQAMHRAGVNFRHLGRVRSHANSDWARGMLLQEMLARVIKCAIRESLRLKMQEVRVPTREVFRETVVVYLNRLLGVDASSDKYWAVEMKGMLSSKFCDALDEREGLHDLLLRSKVDFYALLRRVSELSGIFLSEHCWAQLERNPSAAGGICLVYQDVVKMKARTKQMDIVSFAEGASYCIRAALTKDGDEGERDRLYHFAYSSFKKALGSTPDHEPVLRKWGDALLQHAICKSGSDRSKLAYRALAKYAQTSGPVPCLVAAGDELCCAAVASPGEDRSRLYRLAGEYVPPRYCDELNSCAISSFYGKAEDLCADSNWELMYKRGKLLCYQAGVGADRIDSERRKAMLQQAAGLFADAFRINPQCMPNLSPEWGTGVPPEIFALAVHVAQHCGDFKHVDLRPNLVRGVLHPEEVDGLVGHILSHASTSLEVLRLAGQPLSNSAFSSVMSGVEERPNSPTDTVHGVLPHSLSYPSPVLPRAPLSTLTSSPTKRAKQYRQSTTPKLPWKTKKSPLEPLKPNVDTRLARHLASEEIAPKAPRATPKPLTGEKKTLDLVGLVGITELDLACTRIGAGIFPALAVHCPALQLLDVTECPIGPEVPIFPASAAFGNLVEIRLSRCARLSDSILGLLLRRAFNLHTISLAHCSSLSDSGLALLSECPNLQRVDLSCTNAGNLTMNALGRPSHNLLVVKLRCCPNLGHRHRAVADMVARCPDLQTLSLGGCRLLSDAALTTIVNALASVTTSRLVGLDLSECKVTDVLVCRLAAACPNLRSLVLDGCRWLTDEAVLALATSCPCLQKLGLSGLYRLSSSLTTLATACDLTHIAINGCEGLSDDTVFALARHTAGLQAFEAKKCAIRRGGLVDLFKCSAAITTVDISHSKEVTSEVLRTLAGHCPALQHLALSRCLKFTSEALMELGRNCSLLRTLQLGECKQVTDDAIRTIAENCPRMSIWILTNCTKLTDTGLLSISEHTGRSLKKLSISGCYKVTDAGVSRLAFVCTQLEALYLGRCYKITDSAIMRLARYVAHTLQILVLNGCAQVTDVSVLRVLAACTRLTKLNVESCKVSRKGLLEVF